MGRGRGVQGSCDEWIELMGGSEGEARTHRHEESNGERPNSYPLRNPTPPPPAALTHPQELKLLKRI